jgi:hypothetical protein
MIRPDSGAGSTSTAGATLTVIGVAALACLVKAATALFG